MTRRTYTRRTFEVELRDNRGREEHIIVNGDNTSKVRDYYEAAGYEVKSVVEEER